MRGNCLYATYTKEFPLGGPDSRIIRNIAHPHVDKMAEKLL
jgi:hypothetical protein